MTVTLLKPRLDKPDPEKAAEFLFEISGGKPVRLVWMAPIDEAAPVLETYHDKDDLKARIEAGTQVNLYFVLNEMRNLGKVPANTDITMLRGIVVDIDPDNGESQDDARQRLDTIANGLVNGDIKPTFIIDSGNGIQIVWLFEQTLSRDDYRVRVEAVSRTAARKLGGDPIYTVKQYFRVPFTTNNPPPRKQANGRVRSWSNVVYRGRRTTLEALEAWLKPEAEAEQAEYDWEGEIDRGVILAAVGNPAALKGIYNEAQIDGLAEIDRGWRAKDPRTRSERDSNLAFAAIEFRPDDIQSAGMAVVAFSPEKFNERDFEYLFQWTVVPAFLKVRARNADWFEPPGGSEEATGTEEAKTSGSSLNGIRLSTLEGKPVPQVEFLATSTDFSPFPIGNASLFTGAGGIGKTIILLQLAVSAVTGTAWLHMLDVWVKRGPVLFYSAEEDLDVAHQRLQSIILMAGVTYTDLDDIIFYDRTLEPAVLIRDSHATGLRSTQQYEQLVAEIELHKPVLVIIDNRAQVFDGNESDRNLARAAVRSLQKLARKHKCAVVLAAHPSMSGLANNTGESGSTSWRGTARQHVDMTLANDEDPAGMRLLTIRKNNYGRVGEAIGVIWQGGCYQYVDLDDQHSQDLARAEVVFLATLGKLNKQGINVSVSSNATNYAPKVILARIGPKAQLTYEILENAMRTLLDKELIKNVPYDSDRHWRLELVR